MRGRKRWLTLSTPNVASPRRFPNLSSLFQKSGVERPGGGNDTKKGKKDN